jgi:hypothetical protein
MKRGFALALAAGALVTGMVPGPRLLEGRSAGVRLAGGGLVPDPPDPPTSARLTGFLAVDSV